MRAGRKLHFQVAISQTSVNRPDVEAKTMTLRAGDRLGPCEITALLGAGGMGEIYKARDTRLSRDVAIKVLPAHLSANPELRARVEREAPTGSRPITAEGTIIGTFQYMAPEQLEGKDTDARTDLWALGCVLCEMATGARAFEGTSQASLIAAILKEQPRPILYTAT